MTGDSKSITVEVDGKEYTGNYQIEDDLITVRALNTEKTTQLGGSADSPEPLAKILLLEIIREQQT